MSLRGDKRTEFPQSVRKKAFARCCINAVPHCENCGIELKPGNIEYEHLEADGLGGAATLENCGVWCRSSCSKKKTFTEDNPRMAKADRVLKKNFGLRPSRQKIQSRGFPKSRPQRTASRPIERHPRPVTLTGPLMRALRDVQSGGVFQFFDSRGNSFAGVSGTSPRSYRRLQEAGLICDVRGSMRGVLVTRVQQKLTKAGEAALSSPHRQDKTA